MTGVPDTAVCLGCGYSLRGLPDPVCPECGRSFDPAETSSYGEPRWAEFWAALSTPPEYVVNRLSVLITVVLLVDRSSPGYLIHFAFAYLAVVIPLLLYVALKYVAHLVVHAISRMREDGKRDATPIDHHRQAWWTIPFCGLLLTTAYLYPWPTWIRFQLSKSAFEREVHTKTPSEDWRIVGLFVVREILHDSDGKVFFITGGEYVGEGGILYQPIEELNPLASPFSVHYLEPCWYTGHRGK